MAMIAGGLAGMWVALCLFVLIEVFEDLLAGGFAPGRNSR
jgi:hypothetical protein